MTSPQYPIENFHTVHSFECQKTSDKDPQDPKLMDFVEDFPTMGAIKVANTRTHTNEDGQVEILAVQTTTPDEEDFVKLPPRSDFAVPSVNEPANSCRYWALIGRNGSERHIIRIEFPYDPYLNVDRTDPDFDPENFDPLKAAHFLTPLCSEHLPPNVEPDEHDVWAVKLLTSLHSGIV